MRVLFVALALLLACPPYTDRCRGTVVETCEEGRWRPVIDCAGHGARCSLEPDGYAVCVHPGGAR